MDFIKKNWGLLLYSLGCLVLAVFIGLKISQAAKEASAKRKGLEEQLQWFSEVTKDKIKLTKENEKAAWANKDQAERKFDELRRTLATKYRIEPRHPATSVEAVRNLQDEIRAMGRILESAEPPVDFSKCPALSFQARAQSKDLPSMDDVPKIFRQLRIVQEVVRIVAQSHVLALDSIDRPMDLALIEEDLYTATPVQMVVTGTADQVQNFINKMTTEANYLFFLRKLSVDTADVAPNGALGAAAAPASRGGMPGGMGMEGAMMMEGAPGMGMPGMPGMPAMGMPGMPDMGMGPGAAGRSTRTARSRRPATGGPEGAMPGGAMPGPEGAFGAPGATGTTAAEPKWREDLRAFEAQLPLTAELRFDVIEFNQPEANQ